MQFWFSEHWFPDKQGFAPIIPGFLIILLLIYYLNYDFFPERLYLWVWIWSYLEISEISILIFWWCPANVWSSEKCRIMNSMDLLWLLNIYAVGMGLWLRTGLKSILWKTLFLDPLHIFWLLPSNSLKHPSVKSDSWKKVPRLQHNFIFEGRFFKIYKHSQ